MKKIVVGPLIVFAAVLVLSLFSSCSDEDYLDAIPDNCTALLALDAQTLLSDGAPDAVKDMFKLDDAASSGIDLSAKFYLFETVEGDIGLAAKLADSKEFGDWLGKLSQNGTCKSVSTYKDYKFTVIKDSWVAGFSDETLVVLGPSLPVRQAETRQRIARMLGQESGDGIKKTRMFAKLDSINAPVAIVAQAAALPDRFAAPFMLGAPKDADASQVVIAAGLSSSDAGCIIVSGETFSFNNSMDKELKASREVFRPISGGMTANMPADAALGVFMNVDGERFISLMHSNKTFQTLLAGANMAIDMDKIIKSIDGDALVVMPRLGTDTLKLRMCAMLKSKDFLNDVDYWKKSCPAGSKIVDQGKDAYCYVGGGMEYHFGVSGNMLFYMGDTNQDAKAVLSASANPLPAVVRGRITGRRLAMVLNLGAIVADDSFGSFVEALTGGANTLIYIVE